MPLVDHATALASWKQEHGIIEFERRKRLAVQAATNIEKWLGTQEGLELEPDTFGATQFYRHRILQIAMVLSAKNVDNLPKKHPLALMVFIQDLIRSGKMI